MLLASCLLSAQTLQQRMLEDPKSGASIYRPYFSEGGGKLTAPKGYKPFYISHFGRHGSRYQSKPSYFQPAIDAFDAAKAEGLLTPQGEAMYSAIQALCKEHEGMYGELAPLGAKEHRQIARRMYEREKKVFSSGQRTQVRCASSVYSRCIVSMANFTEELSSLAPSLDITYQVGKRYNDEYLNAKSFPNFHPQAKVVLDSLKAENMHPETLMALYFTDQQKASSLIPDPYAMELGLYYFWAICYDLDFLGMDMTALIPMEELVASSMIDNAYRYAIVAVSEEFGKYTRLVGVCLLKDFLRKAEDALNEDSKVAADLRFAHDSGVFPLCTLLGVEGFPVWSIREAHKNWNAADVVPMCANVQMVFYRGKGDVLVSVLVNEEPASLRMLTAVQEYFYRWEDLKDLIEKL